MSDHDYRAEVRRSNGGWQWRVLYWEHTVAFGWQRRERSARAVARAKCPDFQELANGWQSA